MAQSRYVNTHFWTDNYVYELDPTQKLLFLYLLTNDATNIAGIYEFNIRKAAMETGIDKDMIEKIIDKFTADDRVYYIEGYVILRNFIRHQVTNTKILMGIKRVIDALPDHIRKLYAINDDGLFFDARELAGRNGGKVVLLSDKINRIWLNIQEKTQQKKR